MTDFKNTRLIIPPGQKRAQRAAELDWQNPAMLPQHGEWVPGKAASGMQGASHWLGKHPGVKQFASPLVSTLTDGEAPAEAEKH